MNNTQYYKHLDSIGFINQDQGEYGSFCYMDVTDRVMKTHYIINYDEKKSLELITNPLIKTLSEFFDYKSQSSDLSFLNSEIHSDYSFEMKNLISLVIKEAIRCNVFLSDLDEQSNFSLFSTEIEKKIKNYVRSLDAKHNV
jgi:hypothetical protein